jgi:hypothetical protein
LTHIGSFIPNLMPCVLLIFSIKLGSKMKVRARPDRRCVQVYPYQLPVS